MTTPDLPAGRAIPDTDDLRLLAELINNEYIPLANAAWNARMSQQEAATRLVEMAERGLPLRLVADGDRQALWQIAQAGPATGSVPSAGGADTGSGGSEGGAARPVAAAATDIGSPAAAILSGPVEAPPVAPTEAAQAAPASGYLAAPAPVVEDRMSTGSAPYVDTTGPGTAPPSVPLAAPAAIYATEPPTLVPPPAPQAAYPSGPFETGVPSPVPPPAPVPPHEQAIAGAVPFGQPPFGQPQISADPSDAQPAASQPASAEGVAAEQVAPEWVPPEPSAVAGPTPDDGTAAVGATTAATDAESAAPTTFEPEAQAGPVSGFAAPPQSDPDATQLASFPRAAAGVSATPSAEGEQPEGGRHASAETVAAGAAIGVVAGAAVGAGIGVPPGVTDADVTSTWGVPGTSTWARADAEPPAPAAGAAFAPPMAAPEPEPPMEPPVPPAPREPEPRTWQTLSVYGPGGEQLAVTLLDVLDPGDGVLTGAGYRMEAGQRAVLVHSSVANLGQVPYYPVGDLYLVLETAGRQLLGRAAIAVGSHPAYPVGVMPGQTAHGWSVFLIPSETQLSGLKWCIRPDLPQTILAWPIEGQ